MTSAKGACAAKRTLTIFPADTSLAQSKEAIVHRLAPVAALLVILPLAACTDARPMEPDALSRQFDVRPSVSPGLEHRPMLEIAEQLPSFGGFYFGDQDEVIVALTSPGALGTARDLIRPLLGSHMVNRFTVRVVEYSFLELANYRSLLREHVFTIPGVKTLSVRESENRVVVGISPTASTNEVTTLLTALGIPLGAVSTEQVEGISLEKSAPLKRSTRYRTTTLADQQPDTLVEGGWHIFGVGDCTLGFAAVRGNGDPVMITNSHCTDDAYSLDYGAFYFGGSSGPLVGYEAIDPSPDFCAMPPHYQCRKSDAALIDATADLSWGRVARTTYAEDDEGQPGSVILDTSHPTFEITSRGDYVYENELLHKMGQASGWTVGLVEDTCVDFDADDFDTFIICADRVDYESDGGDSGSPVFYLKGDGTVELRGIHLGRQTFPWYDGIMSNLHQIEDDLGRLIVVDAPVSADLSGPDSVPPSAACEWYGSADPGWPPYTYEWRKNGVVVSTSTDYSTSDTGTSDFTLQFKVTDSRGDYDVRWLNVEIDTTRAGSFIC